MTPGLRERTGKAAPPAADTAAAAGNAAERPAAGSARDLVLGVGVGCVMVSCLLAAAMLVPEGRSTTRRSAPKMEDQGGASTVLLDGGRTPRRVFSLEELREGDGNNGIPFLLSILGEVFDVSAGVQHYGPGATYNCFVGRDASRAFVSGEFEGEGLVDTLDGLTVSELEGVHGWHDFYVAEAKYPAVGVLQGRYYDANGNENGDALVKIRSQVASWKATETARREEFPPW